MRRHHIALLSTCILVLAAGPRAAAAATVAPSFTISATNATMPATVQKSCDSDGTCSIHYGSSVVTLTSVNGYTGSPQLVCSAVNPPARAIIPACYQHGMPVQVTADQQAQEELLLIAPGQTPPPTPAIASLLHGPAGTTLVFAGALLFGLGFRRRRARWLNLLVLAVGSLTVLSGLTACAGSDNSMTPGTYTYQVTAQDSTAQVTATANFTVTIT